MTKNKKILVIVAYADEMALSMGGLIANFSDKGDAVTAISIIFPCYPGGYQHRTLKNPYCEWKTKERFAKTVKEEIQNAGVTLGIKNLILFNFSAFKSQLCRSKPLFYKLKSAIDKYKPDVIVTHWPFDTYSDQIAPGFTVMRILTEAHLKKVPDVLFFESLTGSHTLCLKPDIYIDISENIERKRKACYCFKSNDAGELYFDKGNKLINHFRGRECGVKYAEAYIRLYGEFRRAQEVASKKKGMIPTKLSKAYGDIGSIFRSSEVRKIGF